MTDDLILGGVDITPETDPTAPPAPQPARRFGIVHRGEPGHAEYVRRLREHWAEQPDEVHPFPGPSHPRRPTDDEVREHVRAHTRRWT